VSAPHSVTAPPSTQLSRNSGTSSTRWAIVAGVRKIPLPMVEPMTTATALHRPSRRGSRSPSGRAAKRRTWVRQYTRSAHISRAMTRSYTRLAWSAAACTYLLIILGAIVRITGSGMGCGDHWPLCNGKLLPPLDLPTLIEYGHRLAAALVSVLVSGLAAYAWWLRRGAGSGEQYFRSAAAYVALGLLIVQGPAGRR